MKRSEMADLPVVLREALGTERLCVILKWDGHCFQDVLNDSLGMFGVSPLEPLTPIEHDPMGQDDWRQFLDIIG